MNPVTHPSNTRTLGAPAGWDQTKLPCDALPVTDLEQDGVNTVASFWQPDALDLQRMVGGGLVRLGIVGHGMPPVILSTVMHPTIPEENQITAARNAKIERLQVERLRRILKLGEVADFQDMIRTVAKLVEYSEEPVDVVLYCPACKTQHIDGYESASWKNPPHKTHLCHFCGELWTPSRRATNGVRAVRPGSSATWPHADPLLFAADKMPDRNSDGMVWHPDLPEGTEDESIAPYLWAMGYDASFTDFDGDAPQDLQEAFENELDISGLGKWSPSSPAGGGWRLAAIYDTEDGPTSMWVRPMAHMIPATQGVAA